MAYYFCGEYSYNVDPKGRVGIPQKFREILGTRFIVTRGLDECLFVYPMEEWEKFSQQLKSLPISNPNARQFVRFFMSGAVECELDKQGRILIPQTLRNYVGITKEVVVTGVGQRAEIWDLKKWDEYNSQLSSDEIATNMESLGI